MTDIRGLLTETLAAHQVWDILPSGRILCDCFNPDGTDSAKAPDEYLAHLVDVLLALPIHIVERVEAKDPESEGEWAGCQGIIHYQHGSLTVWTDGNFPVVCTDEGGDLTIDQARSLAAALLSAAATAEEGLP